MTNVRNAVAAAILVGCGALPAHAEVDLGEHLRFSGFGTMGLVVTDTDEAAFGHDRQPGGATTDPDFQSDSNLGMQLDARANSWLSATVQGLAMKRDEDETKFEAEWAFIKVEPLAGLTVRGGRMPLPTFVVSDSRNVGYANTWLRAPNEVYGLNLMRRMQGADISYHRDLGPVGLSVTALYGDSEMFVLGNYYDANKVRGGNLQLETEWATFRAGKVVSDVYVSAAQPTERYEFTGYGVTVDRDNVVAQAEYVERRADYYHNIVAANGWYVMGGYRINAFTPYAMYSSTDPVLSASHPPIQMAVALISDQQSTVAAGIRWDALSSAAFKLQVERVDTNGTKGVSFDGPVSKPATVVSATFDLTF